MRNNFFKLTSSDSIRAQIQKQEIDRIIQDQKRKKQQNNQISIGQIASFHKPLSKSPTKRKSSAFSIRMKKSNQIAKRPQMSPKQSAQNIDLYSQICYFSVKKRYENIIESSFDEHLIRELREELEPLRSARYSYELQRQSENSGSFFQKVFTKSTKMQRYFQELKRTRQQKIIQQISFQ